MCGHGVGSNTCVCVGVEWVVIHVCGCGVGGNTCVWVWAIVYSRNHQQELQAIKASPSKQPISEISVSSPPHSQDCTWSSPPAHGTRPAA